MRKNRYILKNDWKDSRAEIDSIIKDQKISPDQVRRLSITENWQKIEERIYQTFCTLDHPIERPVWLWTCFKLDVFSVTAERPYDLLDLLIDKNEMVWFFVLGDKNKLWFYEGFVSPIKRIIAESTYAIDEIYLASKKYQWLICINHHDDLIATGELMPDKLRKLSPTK